MTHRPSIILIPLAVAILVLGFRPEVGADVRAPQDLGDRVTALEARIAELEVQAAEVEPLVKANAVLEQKTRAHEELLRSIYTWFRSLPAACDGLDAKMDAARDGGFEKAGPNPRAKSAVLDGLKAFARSLNAGNPAKPPKAD